MTSSDEYVECPNCDGDGAVHDGGMCAICDGYGNATQDTIDKRWDGSNNAARSNTRQNRCRRELR